MEINQMDNSPMISSSNNHGPEDDVNPTSEMPPTVMQSSSMRIDGLSGSPSSNNQELALEQHIRELTQEQRNPVHNLDIIHQEWPRRERTHHLSLMIL